MEKYFRKLSGLDYNPACLPLSEKSYLYSITNSIYRVKSYRNNFVELFNSLTKRGTLIEGLVMKRKNARLELGNTENNNSRSQIKCRVPTKNYKF